MRYDLVGGIIISIILLIFGFTQIVKHNSSKTSVLFMIIGVIGLLSCLLQFYLSPK